MLVFLLCGCNHRDTEYKLSDSTGGSTAETVFGNQKEVDEEQTVSEKALEKPQAFRKNVRHRRQHRKKRCRFISAVRSLPRCLHAAGRKPRSAGCGSGRRISAGC